MMMLKKRTAMIASSIVMVFIALLGYLSYIWLNIANYRYPILYIVLVLNIGVASMNIGLAIRNVDKFT